MLFNVTFRPYGKLKNTAYFVSQKYGEKVELMITDVRNRIIWIKTIDDNIWYMYYLNSEFYDILQRCATTQYNACKN